MTIRSFTRTLWFSVALLIAGPVSAEPGQTGATIADLMQQAAKAYADKDYSTWADVLEKLHAKRPYNQDFMRQLVIAYAGAGDRSRAFNFMLMMQQQGLSENWDEIEGLDSLRDFPLYGYLRDLMREAGQPHGNAEVVAEIDPRWPMPEGIALDPDSGKLYVGTIHDGVILTKSPDTDTFEVFADADRVPELKAVMALAVDASRDVLWAATGSISQYRDYRLSDFGRTALLAFNLEDGKLIGVHPVLPDGLPHLLGALSIADDGSVYAADTLTPIIYRLKPGEARPEALIKTPMLVSLRGIALSPDQRKLYVADNETGIYLFDLADDYKAYKLGAAPTLNLGGIDGLLHWNNSLVIIQNGISPQRVMRLDLNEAGTAVEQVAALAVALPDFDMPTWGTLAGDDLLYFASSHWHKVDSRGRPTVKEGLPPVKVLKSAVDHAEEIVVGKEIIERIKQGEGTDY
ncbi:MAG: hypothetical protein Kow0020_02010 [Wenzhouxiangellaceae bacterium]